MVLRSDHWPVEAGAEIGGPVPISRMNHAVLYVRDASRSVRFYEEVLGFREIVHDDLNRYAFMRAPGSSNHHDIAFFTVGADASPLPAGRGSVGLYHLAWDVPTLVDLDEMRPSLKSAGAVGGAGDPAVNTTTEEQLGRDKGGYMR